MNKRGNINSTILAKSEGERKEVRDNTGSSTRHRSDSSRRDTSALVEEEMQ